MPQPIKSWYPYFSGNGGFVELTGWDVILRQIFTVLVTRPGTRQWQPEFGCTLLDQIFEINISNNKLEDIIRNAFLWLPHITLLNVSCKLSNMKNRTANVAHIDMTVEYNGESKDLSIDLPDSLNLMNGSIHQIKVRRNKQ